MNAVLLTLALVGQLNTPLVVVRHPWDNVTPVYLPNAINPLAYREEGNYQTPQTGGQLALYNGDGTLNKVLDAGETGGNILDPAERQVGGWVFYAKRTSIGGKFNLYKQHIETDERVQLTHDEGHNICPATNGRQLFWCSTRDGWRNNGAAFRGLCFLIYTSDLDGKNIECIGRWHLGSALHPAIDPKTGRLSFSTGENMGGGGNGRFWGIWDMGRDGTAFSPLVSSYNGNASHFHTWRPDGRLMSDWYYAGRNGTGMLWESTPNPTGSPVAPLRFVSANATQLARPLPGSGFAQRFMTYGATVLTARQHGQDTFATVLDGKRQGFCSNPSWCPDGILCGLVGSEDPILPAANKAFTARQRIALIPGGNPVANVDAFQVVLDDPAWTFSQPRAVYDQPLPPMPEWNANDGNKCPAIPEGSPFVLLGSASTTEREWVRWEETSGAPTGQIPANVTDADIHYIRVFHTRPSPAGAAVPANNPVPFSAFIGGERMEILADVPIRNATTVLDGDGKPDTSWLAKIPGDTAITLAALNENKEIIALSRTWRGWRPGEIRHDCGGCHKHARAPTNFASTLAYRFLHGEAEAPFQIWDATKPKEPLQYERDIKPILDSYGLVAKVERSSYAFIYNDNNVLPCRALRSPLYLNLPPEVTAEHKAAIRDWIEQGCPAGAGILADDQPPVLYVKSPAREQAEPVTKLIATGYDLHGTSTLSVKASVPVNGQPAGAELVTFGTVTDHVWKLTPSEPIAEGEFTFVATDDSGNVSRIVRTFPSGFSVDPPDPNAERIAEILAELDALAASDATSQATIAANAEKRAKLLEELETLQ